MLLFFFLCQALSSLHEHSGPRERGKTLPEGMVQPPAWVRGIVVCAKHCRGCA